ncbi:hypothetical protein PR202_ga14414 [Eleusine coracana subsp. coracana]|uniref:Prephenate/arogenate dehydrogenase domain-containing protein n=1 Tax=Eleusine coracana subsp. coracana TaxID=191504 RepID=A0AAV5CH47_ELECO|nr:hypothetical protein PR202_ga14414 [Eleusine coracana subsp. coracana]
MDEEVTGSGSGIGRKMAPGEVELKEKSGTAWSHSYLNQKPWHPLSYPNQRRKWIAEQMHANHARRQEEVQREFAQEQEFFRQTALFSKKDKEKMEVMKAVSFMYVRPPGYNAESAKAAEIEDEKKRSDPVDVAQGAAAASTSSMPDKGLEKSQLAADKKNRPKDVFGRRLPTEQEFEVLKNAPRLDTGAPARAKPFGVEIRNVRCLRVLSAFEVGTQAKASMSPPRGGFDPDDPNQQIVAEEIFDEYGGFLGDCDIPALLSNFSASKSKKHSKRKGKHKQVEAVQEESRRHQSNSHLSSNSEDENSNRKSKGKRKKKYSSDSSYSDSEVEGRKGKYKSKHKHKKKHRSELSSDSEAEQNEGTRRHLKREKKIGESEAAQYSFSKDRGGTESKKHSRRSKERHKHSESSSSESERHSPRQKQKQYYSDSGSAENHRHSRRSKEKRYNSDSSSSDTNRHSRRSMERQRHTDSSAHKSDRYSKRSSADCRQQRASEGKPAAAEPNQSKMLSSSTSTLRLHQPTRPHRRHPAASPHQLHSPAAAASRRLRSRPHRGVIRALDAAQPFDYESRAAGLLEERQRLKIAIVGFGNFGQFLARTFARQGHTLLAHSRTDHSALAATLGASFFTDPHDLCECHPDVVLLATSILSAETVLRSLPVHRLRRNTLFVDVLSVKEFPKNLLLSSLPPDFDVICTHPMFGPESARDGWDGLPFVFDKVRVGDCPARRARAEAFLNIFEREGCRMVEMTCAEHDAHAAETQFLTHTVGRMLATLELRSTPINTKGYETLLRLVDNTCSDSFDLYNGLFMYNKNSTELLNRLEWAMDSVKRRLFDGLHDVLRKQLFEGSAQAPNSTSNVPK